MFSLFQNGITDTSPDKTIDFPDLISLIKNNPEKALINQIRLLRLQNNNEYKTLKKRLPNITPNCFVKNRNLKEENFCNNFTASSGYVYFDTDNLDNIDEYKEYFIKKYADKVSMVCKSSSGLGLSILFKITNVITSKEQFCKIWDEIRISILAEEQIDILCKDIGRAMFISYDPEIFYSYENKITLDLSYETDTPNIYEKRVTQPISLGKDNNRLSYSFSGKQNKENYYHVISFDEILSNLVLKTIVTVDNIIVDFKPVEYSEFYIPKVILDGRKHKTYTRMIHQLVYLNPNINKIFIYSIIFFINNRFAKPKMELKELIRLFDFVYQGIKTTGITYHTSNIKFVHFNQNMKLDGKKKKQIANTLNGLYKKFKTINQIQDTKDELSLGTIKVTQKLVSQNTGLSLKTVQTHFNSDRINMDQELERINSEFNPLYQITNEITGNHYKTISDKFETHIPKMNFIHPGCPKWVLSKSYLGHC